MNNEIESLVQKGSLAAWSTVADTKTQPRPRICLPLGVEPNKPRLIWDAQYLNPMCKHSPFQMDGVGKVAQCSWKGAQQVTLDHDLDIFNIIQKVQDTVIHLEIDEEQWEITQGSKRQAGRAGFLAQYLSGLRHTDAPDT